MKKLSCRSVSDLLRVETALEGRKVGVKLAGFDDRPGYNIETACMQSCNEVRSLFLGNDSLLPYQYTPVPPFLGGDSPGILEKICEASEITETKRSHELTRELSPFCQIPQHPGNI